jgi:hypothetical protein
MVILLFLFQDLRQIPVFLFYFKFDADLNRENGFFGTALPIGEGIAICKILSASE